MTSCEPARSSSYNNDLRWRIVWQKIALELPTKQVAKNLCVDPSTVQRICHRFELSGDVAKQTYHAENSVRKLTEPAQLFILHLVLDRPGIYLREIRDELMSQLGVDITVSAICKFLHKAGFTRQKLCIHAK